MNIQSGLYLKEEFYGILEENVQSYHEHLKEHGFLLTTSTVYGEPIQHSIGSGADIGLPEMVFGNAPLETENYLSIANLYRAFCRKRGEVFTGYLGREFHQYLVSSGVDITEEDVVNTVYIRELDREHFLYGAGMPMRYLYTEEIRNQLRVVQFVTSDKDNKFPWDFGYSGRKQLLLEDRKFGKQIPFERSPEQKARARFQH